MLIWSKDSPQSVLAGIGQVLAHNQGIQVKVTDDFTTIPANTTGILCLGNDAKEAMAALNVVQKKRTIGSLRGRAWHLPSGVPVMFSYNPSIVEIDYGKFVDVMTDVAGMIRVMRTGKLEPQLGEYRYVTDFKETILGIDKVFRANGKKPVEVALDLETVGTDEFALPTSDHPGAYIVSIQITYALGKADVLYFKSRNAMLDWLDDPGNWEDLHWLLNSDMISLRGANLKYDLRWLARHGEFECTNFRFDTTLVGALLDENRPNGLDVHAKIYVPRLAGYSDEFDRTVDKSRMDLVPQGKLLGYAGGDTDACLEVSQRQREDLLKDRDLTAFYVNILHPAARAMEMVERGGVCVDLNAFNELESDLNTEALSLVTKARKIMGGRLYYKHMDAEFAGGINLTKASLIKDFMFSPMGLNLKPIDLTEKTQEPSTALEHLMKFQNVPEAAEFVGLLADFASVTKTLGTYVVGFRKHLRSDGRFHPSYWLFPGKKDEGEGGTVTGRLSCKDPAYQTIPKHTKWAKRIRRCYIAPDGFRVLECDYSQGELKVIACIAHEPNMLAAYLNDMDLHALTSGNFSGYDYAAMMKLKAEDPDLYDAIRQLGKAGNFGLIYGMSAEGFLEYAISNYGVKDLTLAAATDFRNGFFGQYTALPEYHKAYKAFAHKHGYVRSPLGRVRHLPLIHSPNREIRAKAERQAINSPVQGTLTDMMIWAVALSVKQGYHHEAPTFGLCHDAKNTYVPEDNWEIHVKRDLEIMENLPFEQVGWKPQLRFTADAKIGANLADLSKVKLAA